MTRILFFFLFISITYGQVPQVTFYDKLPNLNATLQTTIPNSSYNTLNNAYNFTYWNNSFNETPLSNAISFTNYTNLFILNIDHRNLNIGNLEINPNNFTKEEAFNKLNAEINTGSNSGTIGYAVLQNGAIAYQKTTTPTATSVSLLQNAEFGPFFNRKFIHDIKFTNGLTTAPGFTGIEVANWSDRFSLTFRLKPTISINNGQLQFSVTLPSNYNQITQTGNLIACTNANNKGFVIKPSLPFGSITIEGQKITVTTASTNIEANTNYEVGLLFYPIKDQTPAQVQTDALNEDTPITVNVIQQLPTPALVSDTYDKNEGFHVINFPSINMGYNNCNNSGLLQNIKLQLINNTNYDKKIRLQFKQLNSPNIVGFSTIIRNENGDPSGIPVQISKNWHGDSTVGLYEGSWIRAYTEIKIPAQTNVQLQFTHNGATWGGVYAAFSHQLSIAGYYGQDHFGWLEAGIGSYGEQICHSPDTKLANGFGGDIRPLLTSAAAYGGPDQFCSWTAQVGSVGIGVYRNASNQKVFFVEPKVNFKKYGPNLTDTEITALSTDSKVKLNFNFALNRSDDYTRIYYKIKYKFLEATPFSSFDFFTMQSEGYNSQKPGLVSYGDVNGLSSQFLPTNSGTNQYTTGIIPLSSNVPWIFTSDNNCTGCSGINVPTNYGIIIRNYKSIINGIHQSTPNFREKSLSASQYPTIYCLVPPNISSFSAGDEVEIDLELVILPKQRIDYYGPNQNYIQTLTENGNQWQMLWREAKDNQIIASTNTSTANINYPLEVNTVNNEALVHINNGIGYVPVTFKSVSSPSKNKLWKYNNSWSIVDQSVHGKDFWQTDYNPESQKFDITFNVNQDGAANTSQANTYFFGENPPNLLASLSIVSKQSQSANFFINSPFNQNLQYVDVAITTTSTTFPSFVTLQSNTVNGYRFYGVGLLNTANGIVRLYASGQAQNFGTGLDTFSISCNGNNTISPLSISIQLLFSNTAAPVVTTNQSLNNYTYPLTLSTTNGTWNASGLSYQYQWYLNNSAIPNAVNATYTISTFTPGNYYCVVNAISGAASTSSQSNTFIISGVPPINTATPIIIDTNGNLIISSNGSWSNNATSYTYQWRKAGVAISGATSSTYSVPTADYGAAFTCIVSGNNNIGATPATSNAVTPNYMLSKMTAGAAGAYSLRKIGSTATNAIEVRRSSDNTLQNIGFDAYGNLDTAALLTFVGSGDGFVRTWYDQSGNAKDATQTTNGSQPRIVLSGVVETINGTQPAIRNINGTTGGLRSLINFTSNTMTTNFVLKYLTGIGNARIVDAATTVSSLGASVGFMLNQSNDGVNSNNIMVRSFYTYPVQHATSNAPAIGNSLVSTTIKAAASQTMFVNGSGNTPFTPPSTENINSTSFTMFGSNPGTISSGFNGHCPELITFTTNISTSDRQIMERSQGAYYNVTVQ